MSEVSLAVNKTRYRRTEQTLEGVLQEIVTDTAICETEPQKVNYEEFGKNIRQAIELYGELKAAKEALLQSFQRPEGATAKKWDTQFHETRSKYKEYTNQARKIYNQNVEESIPSLNLSDSPVQRIKETLTGLAKAARRRSARTGSKTGSERTPEKKKKTKSSSISALLTTPTASPEPGTSKDKTPKKDKNKRKASTTSIRSLLQASKKSTVQNTSTSNTGPPPVKPFEAATSNPTDNPDGQGGAQALTPTLPGAQMHTQDLEQTLMAEANPEEQTVVEFSDDNQMNRTKSDELTLHTHNPHIETMNVPMNNNAQRINKFLEDQKQRWNIQTDIANTDIFFTQLIGRQKAQFQDIIDEKLRNANEKKLLEAENHNLRARNRGLEDELEGQKERAATAAATVANPNQDPPSPGELAIVKQHLNERTKELSEAKQTLAIVTDEKDRLINEIQDVRAEFAQRENQLIRDHEKEKEQLGQTIDNVKQSRENFIRSGRKETDRLHAQITQLKDTHAKEKAEVTEHNKREICRLTDALTDAAKIKDQLIQDCEKAKGISDEFESQLDQMRKDYEDLVEEYDNLTQFNERLEIENRALKKKCTSTPKAKKIIEVLSESEEEDDEEYDEGDSDGSEDENESERQ